METKGGNFKIASFHLAHGVFWFRIFGRGLQIKNRKIHPDLFSERNGFAKRIVIGNWAIRWLPRLQIGYQADSEDEARIAGYEFVNDDWGKHQ